MGFTFSLMCVLFIDNVLLFGSSFLSNCKGENDALARGRRDFGVEIKCLPYAGEARRKCLSPLGRNVNTESRAAPATCGPLPRRSQTAALLHSITARSPGERGEREWVPNVHSLTNGLLKRHCFPLRVSACCAAPRLPLLNFNSAIERLFPPSR